MGKRSAQLLLELAVVFLGVLIALAADSWLSVRQDQARTLGYMRALQADLSVAQISLEDELSETAQQRAGALAVLAGLEGETGSTDQEGVTNIYWRGLPSVPRGTLEALMTTGDINLLSDSLRQEVVAAVSVLGREDATLERAYELGATNVREFLFTLAHLRAEHALPAGPIPMEVARQSSAVVATYQLHSGMLVNRLDALRAMLAAVSSLETAIAAALRD